MPILVKSDDVRSGRKAKAREVMGGTGVNGLIVSHIVCKPSS